LRLRYGFATLDSDGKTQVMSASKSAHAHEPATRATVLVSEFETAAARVCEDLEIGDKSFRLEVSSAAEIDELFKALSQSGRLTTDS
jgi:hypothetical protein